VRGSVVIVGSSFLGSEGPADAGLGGQVPALAVERPSTAARAGLHGGRTPVQQRDHRDDEMQPERRYQRQPDRGARGRRRDPRLRGHGTSTLATAAVEKPSGIVGAVGRWTIRVIGLPFRVAPGHEPTAAGDVAGQDAVLGALDDQHRDLDLRQVAAEDDTARRRIARGVGAVSRPAAGRALLRERAGSLRSRGSARIRRQQRPAWA
jgi:hypothetical protein